MSGGELFEKAADENNRMSEKEAIHYMRQICEGVKFMHENNVVHLDLKVRLLCKCVLGCVSLLQPENVMFTTKRSEDLKLIDFGLSARLDPKDVVKVTTGTAEFAAPEIVNQDPVGFYSDMWAVGVLAYVL